jgi:hypothetical protein
MLRINTRPRCHPTRQPSPSRAPRSRLEPIRLSGWRDFGVFKNQGDCVSFVATGGKNPPGSSP